MNGSSALVVPERRRSSDRRSPTAGNRGQGGKWLKPKKRLRIYARDGWRCVWCAVKVERLTLLKPDVSVACRASVDHVVPRARGGSNCADNLITACARCNAKRGHRSVPAFARLLAGDLAHVIVRRVRAARRRKLPTFPTETP